MHNFIQAIKTCIMVKLFITGGRASRPEFWWFTLFAVAVRLVTYPLTTMAYLGIIYSIINFIVFVAQYTALVRRLHDTNRSGLHIAPALAGLLVGLGGCLCRYGHSSFRYYLCFSALYLPWHSRRQPIWLSYAS